MLHLLIAGAAAALLQVPVTSPNPISQMWRSMPLNYGSWSYRPLPGGSEAIFQDPAGPQLVVRCTISSRSVQIVRTGAPAGAGLQILTTGGERTVAGTAALQAFDPLLDLIAFSRGRFAVQSAGLPLLVVPAWPEVARAVEDCRK